jgi:hypothetical protein
MAGRQNAVSPAVLTPRAAFPSLTLLLPLGLVERLIFLDAAVRT